MYNFQSMNANVVAGKKDRYSMYMYNAVGMDVDAIEPMGIELVSGSYLTGQSLGRNKIPVLVGEDTAYQFEDTKKVTAIRTVTAGRKQMKTETSSSSRFLISRKRRSPCR